ncbi:MAG: hypothetical protein NC548_11135 [Lachnospiraceae bacterium]|nr:hypothetical protein [Lachnospiraceae bacterium]
MEVTVRGNYCKYCGGDLIEDGQGGFQCDTCDYSMDPDGCYHYPEED